MRIPWGVGVISDATKTKETCTGSGVYELLRQDESPTGFTNFTGWVEKDSGSNVNISAGVATLQGSGAYDANGLRWNTGIPIAEFIIEFKAKLATFTAGTPGLLVGFNTTAALPNSGQLQGIGLYAYSRYGAESGATVIGTTIATADTLYTFRIYIEKAADGTSYGGRVTINISGVEHTIGAADITINAVPTTLYLFVQRFVNQVASLATIQEIKLFKSYPTDSPHVLFTADAGTGKTINGVDFTSLALPTGIVDTNLEFAYYFGVATATPTPSGKLSLTALKALGAISGSYQQLSVWVYQNSNGETQTYGAIVNAEDAIAGMGDEESVLPQAFYLDKSVVSVTAGTVITVTLKHLAATLMTGLTLKGVACTDRTVTGANTLTFVAPDLTAGIGNVVGTFTGYADFPITNGITAQAGASAPENPPEDLVVLSLGLTSLNQSWEYVPDTTSFEVYRSTEISGTYVLISTVTTNSNVDINLSSATDYWYKVKSKNTTGTSPFSDPVKGTTLSMEQAGRTFYYPKIIRRTVIALLDMFNDIKIQRYDKNGTLVKTINVPILFAPQEKFMLLNKRDGSTNKELFKNSPIPRIALGLDGISYNSSRAYSTNENVFYDEGLDQNLLTEYVKNVQPAPYDFNFTLYIRTNHFNDYTQIIEQILPYFNPDLYLRIKEFSFLNVERNMQVLLNGTNSEFLEPQTQEDIRLVNGSLNLTVAGWMYRPISSDKIIKKITAKYNIIEPEEDILVSKYDIDSLGISGTPYF